jgi:hypothetical protein
MVSAVLATWTRRFHFLDGNADRVTLFVNEPLESVRRYNRRLRCCDRTQSAFGTCR